MASFALKWCSRRRQRLVIFRQDRERSDDAPIQSLIKDIRLAQTAMDDLLWRTDAPVRTRERAAGVAQAPASKTAAVRLRPFLGDEADYKF